MKQKNSIGGWCATPCGWRAATDRTSFPILRPTEAAATLLAAAVALGGDQQDRALAALVCGAGISPARKQRRRDGCTTKDNRRRSSGGLPEAAVHSEWAATAVLRPDWSRSAPRLTVLYPGQSCRVELACGKDVLWSGPWALELQIDGAKAAPSSEWSELCWVSDDDVDYLELEISFGDGLCVQRHILLAHEDRFLLLADAVLGSRRAAIEYRGTLPLCPDVTFRQACQPHQGVLVGRKPRATVLPLALPPDCNGGAFDWRQTEVCREQRTGRQQCGPRVAASRRGAIAVGPVVSRFGPQPHERAAARGGSLPWPNRAWFSRRTWRWAIAWRSAKSNG